MPLLIIFSLVAFGMIFGSFANAMVWRLHAQEELRERLATVKEAKPGRRRDNGITKLQEELRSLSMSKGRSMCSNCHHPLAAKDLIPLASWLWLRGKCRYCHQPIVDPPILEAGLPIAFVASFLAWPLGFSGYGLVAFCFWLVFLVAFTVLTLYDIRWYLLPDKVVWPLAGIAAVQVLVHVVVFEGGLDALVAAVWGVTTVSGVFYVLYQVSCGEWIGGGDVKLGIVLGLLVGGPAKGLLLIFIASLLGTLASLPMLAKRQVKRTSIIPFGPFLMVAAAILVLFGDRLVEWFDNFVLLV